MKSFRRTNYGLSNQHLFYNVDIVVYVEGGSKSHTKQEVYSEQYNEHTDDIAFWQNIFDKFNKAKVKFKSVGSKTTVKEIAEDIVGNMISGVMVAMDSEFDRIFNKCIEHPYVFYTYGYSWENDVWSEQVVGSIIEELSALKVVQQDINKNFREFLKRIKTGVYADAKLFKENLSFFERKKGRLFCVECNSNKLPMVKIETLKKRIDEKGLKISTIYSFGKRYQLESSVHCFGHLLADYCNQLVINYLLIYNKLSGISKYMIQRMAIKKMFKHFFYGHRYEHYQHQFSRL